MVTSTAHPQPPSPSPSIPIADLSTSDESIRQKILSSCQEWGFFYIVNHGLPQAHIDRMWTISKAFFALPAEQKAAAGAWSAEQNAGFRAVLPRVPKEQFDTRKWVPRSAYQQPLPPFLEDERAFLDSFKRECAALGGRVLEYLALALGLPKEHFAAEHVYEEPSMDNFELMHYIPSTPEYVGKDVFRLGAHTDWGSLTLLFQEKERGLQVRPPTYDHATLPSGTEEWIDAPVIPGAILINIGDAMHIWSGGELKSTWHRVSKFGEKDRYCAAYFLHPNEKTVIDILPTSTSEYIREKYPGFPKTAKQHLHDRVRQAVAQQNADLYIG